MRCVAEVKYFSIGCLLTVMAPWPGRKRTRATACLRRPVVWVSGAGICAPCVLCVVDRSAGPAGRGQLERLGALGCVGMVGAGVDVELAQHGPAEGVLGQHAADGAPDHLVGGLLQ